MSAVVVEKLDQDKLDADARRCRALDLGIPALADLQPFMRGAIRPDMFRYRDYCTCCGRVVEYIRDEPFDSIKCVVCDLEENK